MYIHYSTLWKYGSMYVVWRMEDDGNDTPNTYILDHTTYSVCTYVYTCTYSFTQSVSKQHITPAIPRELLRPPYQIKSTQIKHDSLHDYKPRKPANPQPTTVQQVCSMYINELGYPAQATKKKKNMGWMRLDVVRTYGVHAIPMTQKERKKHSKAKTVMDLHTCM